MMQPLMQPANTSMGFFLDPGELPPKPVFKSVVSIHFNWLVFFLTILKNMKVNGKGYPILFMEHNKCSKPPTSDY